jgi:hypothetical protein
MALELKTKNQRLAPLANCFPFLARQMSKLFYDTSTGATRCGSFAGNAFSLFGCSPRVNVVYTMIYVVRAA